ncbi:MAG: transcription termination/antitermination protein NusG [Clostridia bacterium]|nr:transcription termination/antitermination protein NusG [Clostridia bacterium]
MNETSEVKWYVVHTYSGYENKVKSSLETAIKNRGMTDYFFDIQIPLETVVEVDGDSKKEVEDKVFPSYVLIKMIMTDQSWHVVRNIRGVTGFVGPGSKPIPLSDAEVAALGIDRSEDAEDASAAAVKLAFAVGDTVSIGSGLLAGHTAVVEEISADMTKVRVKASMFGRDTSIELDVKDVKHA